MQKRQIEDLEPKAEYLDEVLASVSCFTTTQVAKELDMTVHDLTRLLTDRKVMYWQSGLYMLYADYARKGLSRNRDEQRKRRSPHGGFAAFSSFPLFLFYIICAQIRYTTFACMNIDHEICRRPTSARSNLANFTNYHADNN